MKQSEFCVDHKTIKNKKSHGRGEYGTDGESNSGCLCFFSSNKVAVRNPLPRLSAVNSAMAAVYKKSSDGIMIPHGV